MVPAVSGALIPTVFVDTGGFTQPEQSLHYKFLTESFSDFQWLEYEGYLELILNPVRRLWFAGSITEYVTPESDSLFGITVWDSGIDSASTITCEQFMRVRKVVQNRVNIGTVAIVPSGGLQRQILGDCDVLIYDPSTSLDYEVYTNAKGCGTLRRYTLSELSVATANSEFGWQNILVTDEAPLDIETILSGIVTGTRQGELSHLNVRSASHGTPNCYIRGAYELLFQWEGQLVELECKTSGATITPITPEEAQVCWEGLRPDPIEVVSMDPDWTDFVGLLELPTDSATDRLAGLSRFGAKGMNLATLYQRINPDLQLEGFLIPFYYYDQFIVANTWSVDLGDGIKSVSFADTIDHYLDDPVFLSDGVRRRERLYALQNAMLDTTCDSALLADIELKIPEIFGSDDVMVRFRSSSNAEDALHFSGAGLYVSTSVCLADETDGDTVGPSRCDPDKSTERDVCRGLTKVWSSLWSMKAFEEREWYGIDHRQTAMAILVNTRTKGELANIVAFSGNPLLRGDPRYLVNAQYGELEVVSARPGIWPEKDLLTLEDGVVVEIERLRGATVLPDGMWVLDNARLEELGMELWNIFQVYPVDGDLPTAANMMLDTEWKVLSDGRLVIKQVRPFLY